MKRFQTLCAVVLLGLTACNHGTVIGVEDAGCANPCDCCEPGAVCHEGICCTPQCDGRSCGPDGCGGSCGTCEAGYTCGAAGTCECPAESDEAFCARMDVVCGTATGKDACGRDRTVACDRCPSGRRCDQPSATCVCSETDAQLCARLGKECASLTAPDACGEARTVDCGTCSAGELCDAATNSCQVCTPLLDADFCAASGKQCGTFTAQDPCSQQSRTPWCGGCDPGFDCDAASNQCAPCTSETKDAFCQRLAANCGSVTAFDNCRLPQTYDCGSCTGTDICDAATHRCKPCVPESDPVFCSNLGKACGPASGPDTCGTTRSVADCGTCAVPSERCDQGQCVLCVGETDAQLCDFYFKDCGTPTVLDRCGATRVPACGPPTCAATMTCTDGVCSDGVHPTNDTCANPQRLVFDPSGVASATGDMTNASNDYDSSCGAPGLDVVYAFTLTQTLNVEVVVTATSSSVQPEAYIRDNCVASWDLACGFAPVAGANLTVTARLLPAGTYFLIISGYSFNNGTFALSVRTMPPPPPPPNDSCSAPETLVFTNGVASVSGDTTPATDDYSDQCGSNALDGPDVVYKLTLTTASAVVASVARAPTASSAFHPALQLLSTCPSSGAALDCAAETGVVASVGAPNLAAGDYFLVVDSTWHSYGPFTLEVKLLPPATNDLCSNAAPMTLSPITGTPNLLGTVSGDTRVATDGDASTCRSWDTGRDLVYSFEIPAATSYSIDIVVVPTPGSTLSPSVFVRTGCTAADPEKGCGSQWFAPATLHFGRLGPGTYYVFVEGQSSTSDGPFTMTITASPPPPAPSNDTCTRPAVVVLDPATGAAQVTGTTAAAGDDYVGDCSGFNDMHTGPDMVYAVTMPTAGGLSAKVTSLSPSYEPVVYIQSICGDNATDQACGNYDWGGFARATVSYLAAGATYYVIVDGKSASSGDFTLDLVTFGALTNDGCATAKTMVFNASGDFSDRGDLCSAYSDTMDVVGQTCTFSAGQGRDVVYKLVTTQAQDLTVSYASGQNSTSLLYLRTACASPGTQLLCSSVDGGALNTLTAKNLPAGEYYLWLDNAYTWDCGIFAVTAHLSTPPAPPLNDLCSTAEAIPIDPTTGLGATTLGTTESAGNELSGACADGSGGDVVYRFTLTTPKTVEITVTPQVGSDLQPIVYLRTSCAQLSSELSCTAVNATNTAATLQAARLAAGTWYLIVDSNDRNATGRFDIALATSTPPAPAANDACAAATAMPPFDPTTLKTSIAGDTRDGNDDDTSGCATPTARVDGPDLVYRFQLAGDAKVTATVTRDASNTTYKPAVAIRSGCALNREVACKTDSQSGASGSASVTAALTSGTWYVFVDGIDGSYGPFTLEVSQESGASVVAGDGCGHPLALTLTNGTATATGDLSQAGLTDDSVGASCASTHTGPDMVYTLTLSSDSFVAITMASGAIGGSALEPGSYLRRVCDDVRSEVACAETWNVGGVVTYGTPRLTAGTYYLFADASSIAATGTFELTVTVTPASGAVPGNDACRQPTSITFVGGTAQVTGDTSGALDDYRGSGSCGTFYGPLAGSDVVYSFTATAGATLAAVATPAPASGFLPAVYVRDACASGLPINQLGCNVSTDAANPSAGVLVTNLAASTYYVIVDGQGGPGGAFTLDLLLQSAPITNSTCTAALPLAFTTTLTGASVAQVVGDTRLGSSMSEGFNQAGQSCDSSGSELYYAFATTDVMDLTIDLTPLDPGYQPVVYLRSTCADPQTQVVCNSTWSGPLQVQRRLPAGSYTIVTDTKYVGANGPFILKVTLVDPPPPPACDTCGGARALALPASGNPALVVPDSTFAANDDYVGACADHDNPMDGGDVVYSFSVVTNTLVTAKVTPRLNSPNYRAAVYIRATCATVSDDVCAFLAPGYSLGTPTVATASLPRGDYYLIVDGIGGSSGDYDLELSQDTSLYVAGDRCFNAVSLDTTFVPGTLPSETIATFTGTTAGASNDGDGACQSYSGGDLVYSFNVVRNSLVAINLGPASGSSFLGYAYVRTSCTDSLTQVFCGTPRSGTSVAGMIFDVAPGTYYLFVDDLYGWMGGGAFEGSVSVRDRPTPPANDVCPGATGLAFVSGTSARLTATLTGEDSTFATHGSSGNCFWAGGNDLVYTFTTGSAYSFEATVTPDASSGWLRPSMYLRNACSGSTAEVACGGASGAGQALTIRSNQLPAGTWYLFVDSSATPGSPPGGKFDLTARLDAVVGTVPGNDNCSGAQPIALTGQAPSVTALSAQTTVGATDDTTSSCGQAGPDVVYYFDLTAEAQVKATVTGGTGYHPAVFLRSTCATSQVICAATTSGSTAEATAQYLPAGRYFLWVDSGKAGSSGTFDLELTLATPNGVVPPPNDLCNASLPTLTKGVVVTGTTVGAFNNYFYLGSGCGNVGAPGPDVVYAYTPATDGPFSVNLHSNRADLSVWLSEGICGDPNSCVIYNDASVGGNDFFRYPAGRAGRTYYLVVDSGSSLNTGSFTLTVK